MGDGEAKPALRAGFMKRLGFEPDDFQLRAFDLLDGGDNVIVAAPTGAGKTLVASYAVELALAAGMRIFYTTPIKALSNQKFHDLSAELGRAEVGLLTGDNAINGDAPVVVMTTEVLRNMLYAGNSLDGLAAVVLDEVHYLQDAYRGPVWEEVIIHLPRRVQLVCLSATVSNASELAEWIGTVRGPTSLVVETDRPVELENHYLIGERSTNHLHFIKTTKGTRPNSNGFRYDDDPRRVAGKGRGRGYKGRGRQRRNWRTPTRPDVVELLNDRDLLPAIYFIFSRAGCDDAARSVVRTGLKLTTDSEQARVRQILDDRVGVLSELDLGVLGYDDFKRGMEAGIAPHHAGMVPPFKEAVEACFALGLVKVVFATETLALGINMPARTVVIEKLTKFTGDHHEFLTPAQYTQLTGRAGRRGIDTHGKAVVTWSPFVRFEQVADLALSREFVLSSSFRPTYNMAANLVRRYDQERARQLLNLSFAQFRADAGVVRSEHRVERLLERREQIARRIEKEYGPVDELQAALAVGGASSERDADEIAFALSRLTPGDLIEVDSPTLPSPAAVLAVSFRKGGKVRAKLTDRAGETYEATPPDFDAAPIVVGQLQLPEPYLPNSVSFIHEVSQSLARARLASKKRRRQLGPSGGIRSADDVPGPARKALRRLDRIDRDLEDVRSGAARRAQSLAGQFDRVIELLEARGHLSTEADRPGDDGDWALSPSGQRLARLYHECDLLVIEALEDGLFDGLDRAELAGLASCLTYEERRTSSPIEPWFPSGELRRRFIDLQGMHLALVADESDADLPVTRQPDAGFLAIAHAWAAGGDLTDVLSDEEITAGDFVRTTKQLIDLLRQIGALASVPATAAAARAAAAAINRDLVAASSVVEGLDGDDPDASVDDDPATGAS
ncbi:MAG: DEAD/DEAH box helicase [Acidimicrobiia bacterium]|nr:DEAD/DEAH box helicase [Acidimicrobiia bacterium]